MLRRWWMLALLSVSPACTVSTAGVVREAVLIMQPPPCQLSPGIGPLGFSHIHMGSLGQVSHGGVCRRVPRSNPLSIQRVRC